MDKEKRFVHIFPTDSGGHFASKLINTFANSVEEINFSEHLFVCLDDTLHSDIAQIEYYKGNEIQAINKYGLEADIVFVHGFCVNPLQILQIKKAIAKKLIWRTWGHDLFSLRKTYKFPKKVAMWCVYCLYKRKIKQFFGIGIANTVDEIQVRRLYGEQIPLFRLCYSVTTKNVSDNVDKDCPTKLSKEKTRVMVGHSANYTDNHIKILESLNRFASYPMVVSLPLVYGDGSYKKKIKEYLSCHYQGEYEVIEREMNYDEYDKYVSNIDIAILDISNSAALGNVSLLLKHKKKLFLRKNGALYAAFKHLNIPCYISDDLDCISYDTFVSPASYTDTTPLSLGGGSADDWTRLLQSI